MKTWLCLLALGLCLCHPRPAPAQHTHHGPAPEPSSPAPPPSGLSLAALEERALRHNPDLAGAFWEAEAARARAQQAGLRPNPHLGYKVEELSTRGAARSGTHYLFMEQRLVTGGKLDLAQQVAAHDAALARGLLDGARLAALADLRAAFYRALGAQRLVALREELAGVAREAVDISRQLYNVGQADQPDVLAAEMEAAKAEAELDQARAAWRVAWSLLAARVGDPALAGGLAGDLEAEPPGLASLTQAPEPSSPPAASPSLLAAAAASQRASAQAELERARQTPDVTVKLGAGYDLAPREDGGDEGWKGFLELSLPVPWFDDNRGNLAAAEALERRERSRQRALEVELATSLASLRAECLALRERTERFRRDILPRARQTRDMYARSYRSMTAAYPQYLVARRSLLLLELEHAADLSELWQKSVRLESMMSPAAPAPPAPPARHDEGRSGHGQHP